MEDEVRQHKNQPEAKRRQWGNETPTERFPRRKYRNLRDTRPLMCVDDEEDEEEEKEE